MNKKVAITISLAVCFFTVNSQSLSPTVISSSGGFFANGSGMLSETVAELSAVTTISSANNILTQGFQQTWDFGVFVPEIVSENISLGIFPNPSTGNFSLVIEMKNDANGILKVTDATGKAVVQNTLSFQKSYNRFDLDMSNNAEGIYFLSLILDNNISINKKIQIIK